MAGSSGNRICIYGNGDRKLCVKIEILDCLMDAFLSSFEQ